MEKNCDNGVVLGIFGASGLGREFLETAKLVNADYRYQKIVFIDDNPGMTNVQGIPVYSFDGAVAEYGKRLHIALAVGEPITREKIIARILESKIEFETLIHPDVTIPSTSKIGKGCYIAAHSFISCNVTIGNYCLIQPNVNIGHDDVLGDNVSVCGMSTLGGIVTLEDDVFVGMGAAIIQGCRVGKGAIVSMGAVVLKNVEEHMIAFGNPARVMRQQEGQRVFS